MEIFIDYFAPVLVILGLALMLGFLLSYLGTKFEVKRDPRIDKVRGLLPGVNCGLCGYAGCDAFSEALVQGGAKVDMCRPSKAPARESIAAILANKEDQTK